MNLLEDKHMHVYMDNMYLQGLCTCGCVFLCVYEGIHLHMYIRGVHLQVGMYIEPIAVHGGRGW